MLLIIDMKGTLITLLLIIATATQPLLAIPALCMMGAEREKMTCASCCAAKSCCPVSDQQQSTPLVAVPNPAANFVATVPLPPVAVPAPLVQPVQYRSFAQFDRNAHAPAPLALNCIQLI